MISKVCKCSFSTPARPTIRTSRKSRRFRKRRNKVKDTMLLLSVLKKETMSNEISATSGKNQPVR